MSGIKGGVIYAIFFKLALIIFIETARAIDNNKIGVRIIEKLKGLYAGTKSEDF